ncbi:MAG: hypothetical protein H6Q04_509 [Acidobacteria bacterium]|jgi:uncharacterized protein (TIGR02246 family)|nr:hypothetical protein [Acidobacteriota bacterium]
MTISVSKPNTGRRSFLWKAGAAMTAAAAAVVPGMAKSSAGKNTEAEKLAHQLGMLEDEKSIRALHQTYEALLDSGNYEKMAGLFNEDAAVVFNGGVFKGEKSIARLYRDHFSAGLTGKKLGPVPGIESAPETVAVAEDRKSAKAQFPYSVQVGAPMRSNSSLVQMARLHGEGIMKWCESGIYEISYTKCGKDGSWKITKLEYRALSKTDFRPGRAYANPISVPQFEKTYPEDATGPDSLSLRV